MTFSGIRTKSVHPQTARVTGGHRPGSPGVVGCLLLVWVWMVPVHPCRADIYSYIDHAGVIHFTNVPTSSRTDYKIYIREKTRKTKSAAATDAYDDLIQEASTRHDISFHLLKAIIKAESDFNPHAVSRSGAMGLMQIMPGTMKDFKINNPFDPQENIMAGASFFKTLYQRFEGRLPLALAAYNAGPRAVEQYQSIPPFRETENYVRKVMQYYAAYRQ